ncbi:uncharacterized protein LOC131202788 isoform X2 [Ahaetulla prasina]|nr:uncharacterized protein LOC131202788 isoform X2 [Ahaetulla prasina]XP_058048099.1 uncharacterized protein LOC131202788 isoform X2 [Ahaetulla prasina]
MGGPRAIEKGKRMAESILERTRIMFHQRGYEDFSAVNVQILGSEETYGPHAKQNIEGGPREVVVWLAVFHKQKEALEIFSREIAPAATGMAPGVTAIIGGRPKISPVLKTFFFFYPKKYIKINIFMNGQHVETFQEDISFTSDLTASHDEPQSQEDFKDLPSGPHAYRLEDLAYTRSGDKGNTANIGVIARHPLYYPYLKKTLTALAVENYFQHLLEREQPEEILVFRYDLPGIYGLNFVLKNSLGGGGTASLRSDPQPGSSYLLPNTEECSRMPPGPSPGSMPRQAEEEEIPPAPSSGSMPRQMEQLDPSPSSTACEPEGGQLPTAADWSDPRVRRLDRWRQQKEGRGRPE